MVIKPGDAISEEEMDVFRTEVEEAKARPIEFDEDCEELSPAMVKALKCAAAQRNRERRYS